MMDLLPKLKNPGKDQCTSVTSHGSVVHLSYRTERENELRRFRSIELNVLVPV